MRYFVGCNNEVEVKAKFRELVKVHHPDRGGDSSEFIAIKQEYDLVLEEGNYPISNNILSNHRLVFVDDNKNWFNNKTTNIDPKEIEKQRATNHFNRLRENDNKYDLIDLLLTQKIDINKIVATLNKVDDLEVDHFKYVTFKFDKSTALAKVLYQNYINNKMGW